MSTSSATPLLTVEDLRMHHPVGAGMMQRRTGVVKAVDGVSFTIPTGRTLGLVGESGCGKTTTGHCIMRGYTPTAGRILFHDLDRGPLDICQADRRTLAYIRQKVQMVFQDPYSSLNPRMTVQEIVGEPLRVNQGLSGPALRARVEELLTVVGLHVSAMNRFPHAFSGGQRQRLVIARALSLRPALIVADEPVSALDVSIQAQTLNLLQDLQERYGLSYLFIAHDLSVVEHISDEVAVMYVGRIVEMGPTYQVFDTPRHPYTSALLSAVPRPSPSRTHQRIILQGEVPNPANPPSGCAFHPRCRFAEDRCRHEIPVLQAAGDGHKVACHFADSLSLPGIGQV